MMLKTFEIHLDDLSPKAREEYLKFTGGEGNEALGPLAIIHHEVPNPTVMMQVTYEFHFSLAQEDVTPRMIMDKLEADFYFDESLATLEHQGMVEFSDNWEKVNENLPKP